MLTIKQTNNPDHTVRNHQFLKPSTTTIASNMDHNPSQKNLMNATSQASFKNALGGYFLGGVHSDKSHVKLLADSIGHKKKPANDKGASKRRSQEKFEA